jgi:uncharacterized protein (DUF934 family)
MALFTLDGLARDPARRVAGDEPIPPDGLILVPAGRWLEMSSEDAARVGGLIVRPEDPLDGLPPDLVRLELSVERFADGRVFSQARLLRTRYRFTGAISVDGPMLPDQAGYLFRCGVDAIVVPDDVDPDPWARAVRRLPWSYQSSARGRGVRS